MIKIYEVNINARPFFWYTDLNLDEVRFSNQVDESMKYAIDDNLRKPVEIVISETDDGLNVLYDSAKPMNHLFYYLQNLYIANAMIP